MLIVVWNKGIELRFYSWRSFFSLLFSVDSFLVKTRFVGLVDRITIEHDNTGILPDWNLDKVPLTHADKNLRVPKWNQ